MAICAYNARTLASEAAIEDLIMQAKKIKYDVIGLTETRRRHPLNAESLGGGYSNEIDHIIVSKRFCLTDVAVVPKFHTASDHRLLRRSSFTRREEKPEKFKERNPRTIINWDLFATLAGFWEHSAMDNIDEE
ncbi:hypothetical protein RB195_022751 [Necator americanus]|uniref:Endonuclease/exonuclease/phosphatase domain-containing protein n=1 Tax=Necator americanus TaxID=51031 RepID=A0ABR1EGH7_NECAM